MVKLYADLHLHSRYSAATSTRMTLEEIEFYAALKGLSIVGTGDALHGLWLRELRDKLVDDGDLGLYRLREGGSLWFLVQTEVATVHEYMGKARRIHHVILMPNLEVAEDVRERLSRYGDLDSDGRPVFKMNPAEFVELVTEASDEVLVFPAHAWTPWWGLFGSMSGVDRIEECYEDMTKRIYALETGLSSNPPMNWRVSALDRLTLLSFSDSHSPYPYRIGREAVVFELKHPSYRDIAEAIREKDRSKILLTIEVDPAYGKYHWSGHRKCGVGPLSPEDAARLGYRCPVCGRRLTKGVESRVEELADRPKKFKPLNAIPYVSTLPLHELIVLSQGLDPSYGGAISSRRVWRIYNRLISKVGSEYRVLLEASRRQLIEATGNVKLTELITAQRTGGVKVRPGFDGVYGRLLLEEGEETWEEKAHRRGSRRLEEFMN